jgi:hypothetical protein
MTEPLTVSDRSAREHNSGYASEGASSSDVHPAGRTLLRRLSRPDRRRPSITGLVARLVQSGFTRTSVADVHGGRSEYALRRSRMADKSLDRYFRSCAQMTVAAR